MLNEDMTLDSHSPSQFLIENEVWNNDFESDMLSPFDYNFQMKIMNRESKQDILSLPTPPMSSSQSPTNSTISLATSPRISETDTISGVTNRERNDYMSIIPSNNGGRKRSILFEGEDAEKRRKKFLERNRVAAYKCRQKKKTWIQELESKAEISTLCNQKLRQTVNQLKEESMFLRNLLLSHGDCECESVQIYLRKTSAQITSSASFYDSKDYFSESHSIL